MAYMNQEMKKQLAPGIKNVLKKYGLKGSIGVRHHSGLVVNIKEGVIDFINNWKPNKVKAEEGKEVQDYIQVNDYWIEENYTGVAQKCLQELNLAMNGCQEIQNHDNSDIMTDYFDIGWYTYINVGQWDKPYKYIN
jgi:hypothetical protein